MPCFIGGKMKGLSYTQLMKYTLAQNTYTRIDAYNTAIRVRRDAGDKTASYYTFKEGEQMLYKQGQFLLTQNETITGLKYEGVKKL